MPYSKTTYSTSVSAAQLNNGETGIETAQATAEAAQTAAASATTAVAVIKEAPLNVQYPEYGAVGDGSTNDSAAITAAVAALPAAGGEMYFPRGTYVANSVFPSLDSKRGVSIIGEGAPGNGAGQGSELIYTGTTGPFISAKQTQGLLIERMGIRYNNASFASYLIDLRNTSGSGANDTRDVTIRRCYLGSNPATLTSCLALLRCANSHGVKIEDTAMADAQRAILGREVTGDYCIGLSVEGNSIFERFVLAPLHNGGESWSIVGPTRVEQLTSGAAGLYSHDAGFLGKAISFRDLWLGDVTASGGYWVKWSGSGLLLDAGRWGHEFAGGGAILVDENNCFGIEVRGGEYIGGAQVINFGATTGHLGVVIAPAKLATDPVSSTTPGLTAGTVPATARIFNPGNGYWNDLYTDGNLIVPGNGALIQRGQATVDHSVLLGRVSGDAQDRYQLTARGVLYRGLGTAAPDVASIVGSGAPEGVWPAAPGSIFQRTDGGAGTSVYVKESGTGNTGWVSVGNAAVRTKTASYTVGADGLTVDANAILEMSSASAQVFTIPPNATTAFPIGTTVELVRLGAGSVTITPGSGVTIPNSIQAAGTSSRTITSQYTSASLYKRGTNEWVLSGSIT